MTSAGRRTVQVQPEPEISAVPEAVQNHREQHQEQEDDEEDLGIVKRAKESDFTAISMQDQASSDSSSNPDSSLEDYI